MPDERCKLREVLPLLTQSVESIVSLRCILQGVDLLDDHLLRLVADGLVIEERLLGGLALCVANDAKILASKLLLLNTTHGLSSVEVENSM